MALFVGRTSGNGQGIAEAFARHTKENTYTDIIGPDGTSVSHEFVQCDLNLIKNVNSMTRDLLARYSKINFLAKGAGEDAKVFSVLAAGKGGEIDLNDLVLKKSFSLSQAALAAPTYNDLMMEELATRHPDLTFAHAYPGFVRTPPMASSDSTFSKYSSSVLNGLVYPFSVSGSESGEYLLHGLLNSKNGAIRIGSRGEDIGMKRYFGSEEARKKLWEHTMQATQVSS